MKGSDSWRGQKSASYHAVHTHHPSGIDPSLISNCKAKQSKAKQSKAKQSKAKQNQTIQIDKKQKEYQTNLSAPLRYALNLLISYLLSFYLLQIFS